MTKDWNEIKDEACQLYINGWSLPRIRAHLEREKNFHASYVVVLFPKLFAATETTLVCARFVRNSKHGE